MRSRIYTRFGSILPNANRFKAPEIGLRWVRLNWNQYIFEWDRCRLLELSSKPLNESVELLDELKRLGFFCER